MTRLAEGESERRVAAAQPVRMGQKRPAGRVAAAALIVLFGFIAKKDFV